MHTVARVPVDSAAFHGGSTTSVVLIRVSVVIILGDSQAVCRFQRCDQRFAYQTLYMKTNIIKVMVATSTVNSGALSQQQQNAYTIDADVRWRYE